MIRDLLKCFRKIAHGKGFRFKIKLSISEIECSLVFQKQTARSIYKIDWMTVRKCVPISREYSPKQTNKTHSQIDNSPSIYVYIDILNIYNKFSCALDNAHPWIWNRTTFKYCPTYVYEHFANEWNIYELY